MAGAADVPDFVTWSLWALARVGFRPSNCLPIVAVCRDELMAGFQDEVSRGWGRPFEVGALGGMVPAGRTAMRAALSHVPGEDRRHRFVAFAFPHIGVDAYGQVGRVQRRGMSRATTACGALVGFRRELRSGPVSTVLDVDDLEQSYLRGRLAALLSARGARDAGVAVPTLVELTLLARQAAVADIARHVAAAGGQEPVDLALLSGVVVHGPDGQDRVVHVHGEARIDDLVITLPT